MWWSQRDTSIDGQWRRKNAKAWLVTLLVATVVIGDGIWIHEVFIDRVDERCRDSGGTLVTVQRWDPGNSRGPRWKTVHECRGARSE